MGEHSINKGIIQSRQVFKILGKETRWNRGMSASQSPDSLGIAELGHTEGAPSNRETNGEKAKPLIAAGEAIIDLETVNQVCADQNPNQHQNRIFIISKNVM